MQVATHPNCCGYTPITVGSYNGDSDEELQKLIAIVQGQVDDPKANSNRIYEIILNEPQVKAKPRLLKLMAALGFVFIARQHNGRYKDSWINQFIRVQRNDKTYAAAPFEWAGLSVEGTIREHQIAPMTFKKLEVPNPFMAKGTGVFNLAALDTFSAAPAAQAMEIKA